MWYIYRDNEKTNFSRIKPELPEGTSYLVIEKLPPKPEGKYLELCVNFETQKVWWGQKELTEDERKEIRIKEILTELEELDKKVDRVDEDIIEGMYKEFGYIPYTTTAEVINHKEDLRDELKLLKQGVQNESDN